MKALKISKYVIMSFTKLFVFYFDFRKKANIGDFKGNYLHKGYFWINKNIEEQRAIAAFKSMFVRLSGSINRY